MSSFRSACWRSCFRTAFCIALVAAGLHGPLTPIVWAQRKAATTPGEGLFELCQRLDLRAAPEQWRTALTPVKTIQKLVESVAADSPLEARSKLASWEDKLTMRLPQPGMHSLWKEAKYVSPAPPDGPSGSYIYGSLAVINGPLIHHRPPEEAENSRSQRIAQHWSGYLNHAIAVVHGAVKIDGYVNDSILIAAGPIEIEGHISNSIVISLADTEFPLKMDNGYSSHSLLVARRAKVGSFRSSTLIGKLISDDLRGGRFIGDDKVHAQLLEICRPTAAARTSPDAKAKTKFKPPTAAGLLAKLLASEQDAEMESLSDLLAEFQLADEQVQQLIDAADATTSAKRRNALWHSIRLSKSPLGRKYLMHRFVDQPRTNDIELIVEFLDTMSNLTSYDSQLLIGIYERVGRDREKDDVDSPGKILDLEQRVVRTATTPWPELCREWNQYDRVLFSLDKEANSWHRRQVNDRRTEQAARGQFQILLWLAKNGRADEHRISAFRRGVSRGDWVKHGTDAKSRRDLIEAIIASSNRPEFRARLVPLLASYVHPENFLNAEEDEIVRMAAILALEKEFKQTQLASGFSYRSKALEISAKQALNDKSEAVRSKAARLLEAIQRSKDK